MAKRVSKKRKARKRKQDDIGHFLPAAPDIIKAIAMQGTTDDELALMFGLDPKIITTWREYYPSFDKAIEEGRTLADLQVIEALHTNAIGHTRQRDVLVKVRSSQGKGQYSEDVEVHTVREQVSPETNAIKMWLQNRDPERWNRAGKPLHPAGKETESPLGTKNETKLELMSSILSLIHPKPDGA